MPDNLPSSLYTGGATVFNSMPFANFYVQAQARKRAKDEALTKYFADFTKSVNPAGMRTKDIEEGWMQKRNDWEKFYMDNADKIKNVRLDNGKAYGEFMGRYQDLLNDTQKSKNEVEQKSKLFPLLTDPEKRDRLTDNVLPEIHQSEYSIYDPRYKPFDITRIDFNAKQVDAGDLKKYQDYLTGGIKMSEGIPTISIDPKTKSKISTTKSSFKPEDINLIASKAENLYKSDSAFQRMIDGLANPADYERLNKVFKETYGHDLDIQHHEELATAWALSGIQKEVTSSALTGYSPYDPYQLEALREKFWNYTNSQEQGMLNFTIDALFDNQVQAAKQGGMWGGASVMPVDPATLKALGVSRLLLSPDGKIIPESDYVAKDAKGIEVIQSVKGASMTPEQYKAALGKRNVGTKYFQQQEPKTSTTNKSGGTKKEIKKSEIAAKAAAAGYTPKEYEELLKNNGVKIVD